MLDPERLRRQVLADIGRLDDLILRYAAGDKSVKQARDWLTGAVEIKLVLLRAAEAEVARRHRRRACRISPTGPML